MLRREKTTPKAKPMMLPTMTMNGQYCSIIPLSHIQSQTRRLLSGYREIASGATLREDVIPFMAEKN